MDTESVKQELDPWEHTRLKRVAYATPDRRMELATVGLDLSSDAFTTNRNLLPNDPNHHQHSDLPGP